MKNAYESYSVGLKLSHLAMLRNLDRFVQLAERGDPPDGALAGFLGLFARFLDVHHRSEDEFVLPALRRHSPGKTTDAAHLERWTSEHRDICALGTELSRVGERIGTGEKDMTTLRKTSTDLQALLAPHVASEEEVLSPTHLPNMIPERELARAISSVARSNASNGIAMAAFLATSLEHDEQKDLFGDAPWIFRRFVLGVIGARKMRPYHSIVHTPSIAL
jgi:hypothetical protein